MMKEVKTLEEVEEIAKNYPYAFVAFYSPHCEVCKELEPLFYEAAKNFPQFAFVRINVLEANNLEKYDIESPTLLIFKDGNPVKKLVVEREGKEGMEKAMKEFFSSLQK